MGKILKGRRHQNAWKHCCFQTVFVPLKGCTSVAAEVRNLKNTVWKTPFGTIRVWHAVQDCRVVCGVSGVIVQT